MENIIYNELRYRGYIVDVSMVIKREGYKNKDINKQLELDFIANLGNKKYYIQFSYSLPSIEKKQEKASLLNIDDSFKKVVIIKDRIKSFFR